MKCWGPRRKPGEMDFARSPQKHIGGEILNPFYLAYMIHRGGFCRGCEAICWMCLLLCQSYPGTMLLKFCYLKVTLKPRTNISSFLVVRLNNNNDSCITKFQSRCLEPSSKILCTSKFRLGKQLAGLEVFAATPTKSIWKRR